MGIFNIKIINSNYYNTEITESIEFIENIKSIGNIENGVNIE